MAGYLDQYGAGEDRRNSIISRLIITTLSVLIVSALGWYLLKNHHQEGVIRNFLSAVRGGDLKSAYRIWGCTDQQPCSAYDYDKFTGDWGPKATAENGAPDLSLLGLTDSESCNDGVLLTVQVNANRNEKLWVNKGSDSIGFAPFPVCPHKGPFSIMMHRTIGKLRKPLLK